ncbi:MAG: hypothetical protein HY067_21450 [Betaproteobacteria bacterium]|nr:hypothetical protein [Betaproteobacteria bacterium]
MNIFITSVIWVTVGASIPSLAIDQTELFPTREAGTVEAQCPSNCQGDFPVSSNRKYAEAHEAHHWSRS